MIENQKIKPDQVIGPLGEPLTLADLPRQCRSVLAAPARAQSGLAISSKTGRPAPSTYSSSYAAPATVPLPRFRPDR